MSQTDASRVGEKSFVWYACQVTTGAAILLSALFSLSLAGCKARGASDVRDVAATTQRIDLMEPARWEPAGDILSPVFRGTSDAWLTSEREWTLPGMSAPRDMVEHRGWSRPNHMQYAVKTKQDFGAFRASFAFQFVDEDVARLAPTWLGNSGLYIFGLYEIQIFRSGFYDQRAVVPQTDVADGVVKRTRDGHVLQVPASQFFCGSVYSVVAPTNAAGDYVNACADDGAWHEVVVTFTPATGDTRATVEVELDGLALSFGGSTTFALPGPTGSQRGRPETATGPLVLQDHGSSVRFRSFYIEPR